MFVYHSIGSCTINYQNINISTKVSTTENVHVHLFLTFLKYTHYAPLYSNSACEELTASTHCLDSLPRLTASTLSTIVYVDCRGL